MASSLIPVPLSQLPPAIAPLPAAAYVTVNVLEGGVTPKTLLAHVNALGTRLAEVYRDAPQLLPSGGGGGSGTASNYDVGMEAEQLPPMADDGVLTLTGGGSGEGTGTLVLGNFDTKYTGFVGSDEVVAIGPTNSVGEPIEPPTMRIQYGGIVTFGGQLYGRPDREGKIALFDLAREDYGTVGVTDGYFVLGAGASAGAFVLGRSSTYSYLLEAQNITGNHVALLPDKDGTLAMLIDIPDAVTPFNMGQLTGTTPIDFAEGGRLQYGHITGDWTPSATVGGVKGNQVVVEIQWVEGPYTLDLTNAARLTAAQLQAMPALLEQWRCFQFTLTHMGGWWCLTDITDSYTESED